MEGTCETLLGSWPVAFCTMWASHSSWPGWMFSNIISPGRDRLGGVYADLAISHKEERCQAKPSPERLKPAHLRTGTLPSFPLRFHGKRVLSLSLSLLTAQPRASADNTWNSLLLGKGPPYALHYGAAALRPPVKCCEEKEPLTRGGSVPPQN